MTDIRSMLGKRDADSHKGDYGKLLIYAGSTGMCGAAILCARGALRSGTGLVYLAAEREMFPILQTAVPEAICLDRTGDISYEDYDAAAFGPGMGKSGETAEHLRRVLSGYEGKLVIDADGLNVISAYDLFDEVKDSRADIVITPHEGEAARLLGGEIQDRDEKADALAELMDVTAVLKGSSTIVTDGERKYINDTGNPGMATAGSGDVLTGVIGSLLGQGKSPYDAAVCGVYIHGLAGDTAADIRGQWGITAGDIAECVSLALKKIIGE